MRLRVTPTGMAAAVAAAAPLVLYAYKPALAGLLWLSAAMLALLAGAWGLASSAMAAVASGVLRERVRGPPRAGPLVVEAALEAPAGLPPGSYTLEPRPPSLFPLLREPGPVYSAASRRAAWAYEVYALPGRWCWGPARVRASDPLGFFEASVTGGWGGFCVEIPPRVAWSSRLASEAAGVVLGRPSGRRGAGTAFLYLREYEPGDDPRLVEWKATARLARPVVRVHEAEEQASAVLLVSLSPASLDGPPGFTAYEAAMEAAATAAAALARAGSKLTLIACTQDEPLTAAVSRPADAQAALAKLSPPLDEDSWRRCLDGLPAALAGLRQAMLVIVGDGAGVEEAARRAGRRRAVAAVAVEGPPGVEAARRLVRAVAQAGRARG